MSHRFLTCLATGGAVLAAVSAASAGSVVVNGIEYPSRAAYYASDYFQDQGMRCGLRVLEGTGDPGAAQRGSPSDCSANGTTVQSEYDPGAVIRLQVVVHVLRDNGGFGDVSDALIQSQIAILNEDFLAIVNTNGEEGTYAGVQFQLATEDPSGQPTTGITRWNNTNWHNDSGQYWNTVAWDPAKYVNIYLNNAQGFLGYVPWLPQEGNPGSNADRIVCLWDAFGRNAPGGSPYDQGRTATHEVGHYLGLHHTFNGSCGPVLFCSSTGDLICDTAPEAIENYGCPPTVPSCDPPKEAPFHNYMDYTDDLCMTNFTPDQVNRVRCTITHYRSTLPLPDDPTGVRRPVESASFSLLHQNVPNPFRPSTLIRFELPRAAEATLTVLDVTGRAVRTLTRGELGAGAHSVSWNGDDAVGRPVASGVYFYRLESGDRTETRRMVRAH